MPRPSGTQTRAFVYDAQQRLAQTVLPENGTTTYAYDENGRVQTKSDARGYIIAYEYDGCNRVTAIRRGTTGNPDVREQRTLLSYDTGSGANLWGRLAAVTTYQNFARNPWTPEHETKPVVQELSYSPAGLMTGKSLSLGLYSFATDQDVARPYSPFVTTFAYDNEGRMLTADYPDIDYLGFHLEGPRFDWGYNGLGQPTTMTRTDYTTVPPTATSVVTNATYNVAGQMLTMVNGGTTLETRTYSTLGQLTRQTGFGLDYEYRFSASANDGRAQSRKDWVSGEDVQYQYDSLGRLSSAATVGPEWGLSFAYDGFGNKLAQSVTKGTGPALSLTVDPATNRVTGTGVTYDANGNLTSGLPGLGGTYSYDAENRLLDNGVEQFGYGQGNQRVWKRNGNTAQVFITDPNGQLLTVLSFNINWGSLDYDRAQYTGAGPREYFAGRLMGTDRLGGKAKTYPYGEEKSPATGANPKFATYDRDPSGLDYAQNRYYSSTWGRFVTADPYQASGGAANPGSWNRYAYAGNDPAGAADPTGLDTYVVFDKAPVPTLPPNFCTFWPSHAVCTALFGRPGSSNPDYPNDATQPQKEYADMNDMRTLAQAYASAVKNGAMSDCMALSYFADAAAVAVDPSRFIDSFRVFYGQRYGGFKSGVRLEPSGHSSGYRDSYQNNYPRSSDRNEDQAHHFAFFLTFGGMYGGADPETAAFAITAAAAGLEVAQLTPRNLGDMQLGVAAGMMGYTLQKDYMAGNNSNATLGSKIRSQLCK